MSSKGTKETLSVLVIRIGSDLFAVNAATIHEVVPIMNISGFPDKVGFLEGFIDIRGTLYAVMDLLKRFEGTREQYFLSNRIILIQCEGRNLGFIVDEILRMEEWQADEYQNGILSKGQQSYIEAIGLTASADIPVINLCKIPSEQELALLAQREK